MHVRFDPPGRFRSLDEFASRWRQFDPSAILRELPGDGGALGRSIRIGDRELHNRFACQPMEGWDGTTDGRPSELTLRRWRNFGRSGASLIWGGEAYAVLAEGRANPAQLCREGGGDPLRDLVELRDETLRGVRESGRGPDEVCIGLQLTHSGRFARPHGVPAPKIAAPHPALARKYPFLVDAHVLSDGELERIAEAFVATAKLADSAGFDFVDVKCCHGYLLHELLGARDRDGRYGGDFTGRTRLLRRIVAAIAVECPRLRVGVRLSVADTAPYEADPDTRIGRAMAVDLPYRCGFGVDTQEPTRFDLSEPLELIGSLARDGVTLWNLSLGSPYTNPHLQRPAAYPPSDGYLPPNDPLAYVFEHLRVVREVRAAVPAVVLVGSGYTYLQEWLAHVGEAEVAAGHVDFVGLGRMLLSHPDLPAHVLSGRAPDRRRICRTFSDCTTAPRNGMVSGCYPLDPFYRAREEAVRVRELRDGGGA
ncbi:MAG: NADH:flavin oxidoreductase [Planctomycetota bacterium]